MAMNLSDLTDDLRLRRTVDLFDDFNVYVDTQTHTKGGTGTVTNVDNVNGLLTLATGATLNNEAWVATTRKNWLLQNAPTPHPVPAGKPLIAEGALNYQEANVNTAGIFFGLSDSFATGLLVNTTLVPKSSFSGMAIYKQAGENVWRTICSNGSTQLIHKSTQASGLATDQVLRIEARVISASLAEVVYFVDGLPLYDAGVTNQTMRIKDQFTITALNKMALGLFVKTGAAFSEVVNFDYECVLSLR
jgi:hypothetical protein